MFKGKIDPQVLVPLRTLTDFEELARRALEACSITESFLLGLSSEISVIENKQFYLNPEPSPDKVRTFGKQATEGLGQAITELTMLHTNLAVAKRDHYLARMPAARRDRATALLRGAPLTADSLFGGIAPPLVKKQADAQRDITFSQPPRYAVPPGSFKRPLPPSQSGPRQKAPRVAPTQKAPHRQQPSARPKLGSGFRGPPKGRKPFQAKRPNYRPHPQ